LPINKGTKRTNPETIPPPYFFNLSIGRYFL